MLCRGFAEFSINALTYSCINDIMSGQVRILLRPESQIPVGVGISNCLS